MTLQTAATAMSVRKISGGWVQVSTFWLVSQLSLPLKEPVDRNGIHNLNRSDQAINSNRNQTGRYLDDES